MGQWAVEIPAPAPGVGIVTDDKAHESMKGVLDLKLRKTSVDAEGSVMSLRRGSAAAYGQCNLCFRNLAFSIKSTNSANNSNNGPTVILTPTSGAYSPGSMVALMVRR